MSASQIYDLLAGTIVPRPIALVSTVDTEGNANLAPFSFFMPGGVNPPSLAFSPTLNMKGERKDTLANIEATREFTVNLVERSMATEMNLASFGFPPGVSEWASAGLTAVQGEQVRSSRIAESRVAFECRLFDIVRHGDGPSAAVYVIGEILLAFVDDSIEASPLRPIGRLGGAEYVDLAVPAIFDLPRPK